MGFLGKLDPFYWFDRFWFSCIGRPENIWEKIVYHAAEVLYAVVVAYSLYIVLGIVLNTPKPAVIVASQSMEPTLWPGDIALVFGSPPESIRAPSVEVNTAVYGKPLSETPVHLVRKGKELVGFSVNGAFIPLEQNGDVIVYYNDLYGVDIVHRAVLKIVAPDGVFFLTKGDNARTNPTVDQDCEMGACIYLFPVPAENVYGKVFFAIPRIGILKLWLFGR
ncbi:MAG TPA: hypothetical protein EYH23_01925 [Euryarchaeota archaeon]|nr:hypothetical protein [Euryarchaeota archaeon]